MYVQLGEDNNPFSGEYNDVFTIEYLTIGDCDTDTTSKDCDKNPFSWEGSNAFIIGYLISEDCDENPLSKEYSNSTESKECTACRGLPGDVT